MLGRETSACPSPPWLDPAPILVLWAQCCYRDQQSDHCTSGTCFPERWTKMRISVGHLSTGQRFPIFLLKSQEREALHALPFITHPSSHSPSILSCTSSSTVSQGALCRQLLQTPMSSLQSPGGSLASGAPTGSLTGADCRPEPEYRGNKGIFGSLALPQSVSSAPCTH